MTKKYTPPLRRTSWKILVIFWIIAILILAGWYVFLQVKYRNIENLKPLVKIAPIGNEKQNEVSALLDIYNQIGGSGTRDQEKNLLVLFQNDLELRPGGGFIGAFGVIKLKNGKIENISVQDTGNFDKNISEIVAPPAPLAEILGVEAWKMRDSNWSPDFRVNAQKAEYFYHLGGGNENIDGVIAINTRVLNSILAVTGPVKIEGYPGEYHDENAILQLEYQVEKGYAEQGIAKGERKNIMGELADALSQKTQSLSLPQQISLAEKMEEHLRQKDIQLFFQNENLQREVEKINWGGRVQDADSDYLMAVDANLLSLKSDYCIQRKMDYNVDLSKNELQAVLNITYVHTCRAKDWMTADYRDWLRVYAPNGAFLLESNGQTGDVNFSEDLGKKVFAMRVDVPVGESRTVTLKYQLPDFVKNGSYKLLVQKQSGSGDVPIEISVRKPDGSETSAKETLTGDREFGF